MMAFKYQDLEKLTIDQLKQAYDLSAINTVVGLGFYREEIARREADALNHQLSKLTPSNA